MFSFHKKMWFNFVLVFHGRCFLTSPIHNERSIYWGTVLLLILTIGTLGASLCNADTIPNQCVFSYIPEHLKAEALVSGMDLDGYKRTMKVEWVHQHHTQTDTFRIFKEQNSYWSWMLISDSTSRVLYSMGGKAPRLMALHHLRERIWNTPLRYDHLALLTQNAFVCDKPIQKTSDTFSSFTIQAPQSQVWWGASIFSYEPDSPADSIQFRNRYEQEIWHFEELFAIEGHWLPHKITLHPAPLQIFVRYFIIPQTPTHKAIDPFSSSLQF
jgi:hypothetical protein